jgi:adenylosuccinate lyase
MKAKAILTAKYTKESQSSQRKEYEELTQTLSAVALAKAELHREVQRYTEKEVTKVNQSEPE